MLGTAAKGAAGREYLKSLGEDQPAEDDVSKQDEGEEDADSAV
jgi:hypothetical protein